MLVQKKTRSILTPSNGRARVPSEAAHTPARDVCLSSLVGDRERRSGPHRRWGGQGEPAGGQGEPAAARGAGAARGESDPQIPLGRRPWRRRRRVRGRRRSPRPHGQGRRRWQDARVTACARRARGAGPQHRGHARHTHHARWPSRRQGLPPPSPGSTAWRVGERGASGLRDALCTKRCGPHLGSGGRPAHPQNAASPIWDRGVALSTVTSGRGVTVHTQLLSGLASGLHSGHSRGIGGSYAAEDGGPGAPREKQEHSGRS